jgi:hypothetical protein
MIFVFGSNEAGIHGAGAAAYAMRNHGAVYGMGQGRKGNSYAIPTKNLSIKTLPMKQIVAYVKRFLDYAAKHSELKFQVTAVGCGLAGLTHAQMAPLFLGATSNCWFDTLWEPYLGGEYKYWGTFNAGAYVHTQAYAAVLEGACL